MAIIFGDAVHDSGYLYKWATLDSIDVDSSGTRIRFSNVRELSGHSSDELIMERGRAAVSRNMRRGYSVVFTPDFLVPQEARTRRARDKRSRGDSGSIVGSLKESLEQRGEYVVRSNTNWFAMFPTTWHNRAERARREGRDGPNLIVYRTRSSHPRDHYVIPYSLIRDIIIEDTLSDSVNGSSKRWNLTLDDGKLHVTHREGKIEVGDFHGARLLIEEGGAAPELTEATADPIEFERRVRGLRRLPYLTRPVGRQVPARRTEGSRTTFERRPDVKAWVLLEAKGRCELCAQGAPFAGDDGEPYLEVHHVRQLAEGGPDIVENAVALCPNCHRRLHHGADRADQRERLYGRVARLVRG